jgi:signal peptidase
MEENKIVEENKEPQDKKALVKKILVIVGNVVFYAIIIVLFLFSLMNINAGNGTQNFPNLFGKGMLSVESNSMERDNGGYHPAEWDTYGIGEIKKGDLVYDDVFNGDINSLKIGDVITFYDAQIDALNTHRIVYIDLANGYVVTQGDYIITQSTSDTYYYDATNTNKMKNDQLIANHNYAQIVHFAEIKGVVTGVKAGGGAVLSNIRQNWLFYFVIPIAVILLVEIVFVVKNFLDLRHEKNKADLADDKEAMLAELEAEKEKMRQELLAELRAQQAAEAKPLETAPVEEEPQVEPEVEEPAAEAEQAVDAVDEEPTVEAEETKVEDPAEETETNEEKSNEVENKEE